MDMADYSEALDPAYTTLEFENMQVLPLGTGESHICSSGVELWNFYWFKTLVRSGQRGVLARSDKKGSFVHLVALSEGWSCSVVFFYHLWVQKWNIKGLVDLRDSALFSMRPGHLVGAVWACRLMRCQIDYSGPDIHPLMKQSFECHDPSSPVTNGPFPQNLKGRQRGPVFREVFTMTPTYLYMQSPMTFERDPDSKIPNSTKKKKEAWHGALLKFFPCFYSIV